MFVHTRVKKLERKKCVKSKPSDKQLKTYFI